MNIRDFHLSKANGDAAAQLGGFGDRIRAAQKGAAGEWASRIDMFLPGAVDLLALPDGSWLLQTDFQLAKPFTSKADNQWFESQNPIVRDHLTGLPVVRPTAWKGHLSFAVVAEELDPAIRDRLFGTARGGEVGQAGRLHFFTTFFLEGTGREVVTPLWRDTRTPARGPIDFDVIEAGRHGRFLLLYVPRPKGKDWSADQMSEDLELSARAVKAMLLDYGFSAKKTSGWGIAEDTLHSAFLAAKGACWPEGSGNTSSRPGFVEPDDAVKRFMGANGHPDSRLRKPLGAWLSNLEYKTAGVELGSLTECKRFRAWYDTHGAEWVRRLAGQQQKGRGPLQLHEFSKISEFPALAERLAKGLREACGV